MVLDFNHSSVVMDSAALKAACNDAGLEEALAAAASKADNVVTDDSEHVNTTAATVAAAKASPPPTSPPTSPSTSPATAAVATAAAPGNWASQPSADDSAAFDKWLLGEQADLMAKTAEPSENRPNKKKTKNSSNGDDDDGGRTSTMSSTTSSARTIDGRAGSTVIKTIEQEDENEEENAGTASEAITAQDKHASNASGAAAPSTTSPTTIPTAEIPFPCPVCKQRLVTRNHLNIPQEHY